MEDLDFEHMVRIGDSRSRDHRLCAMDDIRAFEDRTRRRKKIAYIESIERAQGAARASAAPTGRRGRPSGTGHAAGRGR